MKNWLVSITAALLCALIVLYASSTDYANGGLVALSLFVIWAIAVIGAWTMILLKRIRRTKRPALFVQLAMASSAAIVVTIALWRAGVPMRCRFAFLRPSFDEAATVVFDSPDHSIQWIGNVRVLATFNNPQGVWFRTFQRGSSACGFFQSTTGQPPQGERPDEQVSSTALGGSWFYYRLRRD